MIPIRLHFHSHASHIRLSRRGCRETIIARVFSPCFVCVTVESAGVVYDWFDDDLLTHRAEDHEHFRPGPRRTLTVMRPALTLPAWRHLPYRIAWRNCAHFAAACIGLPWMPCLTPDALWVILVLRQEDARDAHADPAETDQPKAETHERRPLSSL